MSAPELRNTITTASAAEKAIADLESIMDHLEHALTEETARVRAGKLRDAGSLSEAKIEFARLYALESARIRAAKEPIERWIPDAFERLRERHKTFQDLLQTNLTVLATAHAVSEGIIRGVSGELARKQAPSTYGANGRAQAPSTKTTQPLALSRCL
jgi:flagellar biosynthesis/type III secretory pathway chaperone